MKKQKNKMVNNRQGNRIVGLDYLKALSIIMVIMFHYEWNSGFDFNLFSYPQRILMDCIWMFGEIGVNCFMLCTGFLLIGNTSDKNHLKRISKRWLEILFYSICSILLVHFFVTPYELNYKTLAITFFPIAFNVWWYTSCYFIILCISPYINKMLHALTKDEYKRLLLVLFILFSFIPTLLGTINNDTESLMTYNRLIWMVIIYSFGGYIKLYGNDEKSLPFVMKHPLLIHLLTWLGLLSFFFVLEKWPSLLGGLINARYFWQPNSIPILIISTSLFVICLKCSFRSFGIVNLISASTLGIYQMHAGRSGLLWWNNIFHNPEVIGSWRVFQEIFCAVIIIVLAGILMEYIRKGIFWIIKSIVEFFKKTPQQLK